MGKQASFWQALFSDKEDAPVQNVSVVTTARTYTFYRLNAGDFSVIVCDFGARILSFTKDHDTEIVISPANLAALEVDPYYMGVTAGRVCNRIGRGRLDLGDYGHFQLSCNANGHHLHGGSQGFGQKVWAYTGPEAESEKCTIELIYHSPAGEEGYPGSVRSSAQFSLNTSGELRIDYETQSLDAATVANLTQHAYWNLSNDADEEIYHQHSLLSPASSLLEFDADGIPNGQKRSLDQHRWDFRTRKRLADIDGNPGFQGIDNYFIVPELESDIELPLVAQLRHEPSGRSLSVYSNQLGFQIYTATYFAAPFKPFQGLCIETSAYIDAPNHRHFPSILLEPGQLTRQTSIYRLEQPVSY